MTLINKKEIKRIRPKVSIGMPVFNGESFIENAINSILSQTFKDFELVISDNNSDDKTEEICKQFLLQDERVKYIKHEKSGAMNNFMFAFTFKRRLFYGLLLMIFITKITLKIYLLF